MKFIDEEIEDYAVSKSWKPGETCQKLANYTKKNVPMSQMLIGPMEASLLAFLIRSSGCKNILEIGTYTGYSSLAMAENLPSDGKVTTLDIDPENTRVAQKFWSDSPVGNKIELILGPALESMQSLKEKGERFDLIFVDADKENYLNYLKSGLELLSEKGMFAFDNVLWSGKVIDAEDEDSSTLGIRELNDYLENDQELFCTLLPVRDGVFLVMRKEL